MRKKKQKKRHFDHLLEMYMEGVSQKKTFSRVVEKAIVHTCKMWEIKISCYYWAYCIPNFVELYSGVLMGQMKTDGHVRNTIPPLTLLHAYLNICKKASAVEWLKYTKIKKNGQHVCTWNREDLLTRCSEPKKILHKKVR